MESTLKFSGRAKDYTMGRPVYAEAFVDSLYMQHDITEQADVADVGSGTGKFARQLLARGSRVYCVEPNDDMRNTAIKELQKYEKFHAVKGTATDTTLSEASVDFVTVAQAFHWFDAGRFQKECRRILRPNGKVFLIWNMRDMTAEMNRESFEIYRKYCPDFKGFGGGIQKDDRRIKLFFDSKYEYVEYDNPLFYDKEKFISRSLSGSYSLQAGDEHYQEYIKELSALFDKYADDDMLTMENKTVVYWGRMN